MYRKMASIILSKYSFSRLTTSSGLMFSDRDVNPRTSANRTVIFRRSLLSSAILPDARISSATSRDT